MIPTIMMMFGIFDPPECVNKHKGAESGELKKPTAKFFTAAQTATPEHRRY